MTFNSGTATDYIDLLDQLVQVATSRHLSAVAVNAGGTGHAVGDIIDITATGSTSTHVAKIEVTSVSGGVIDGVRVYRGGAYTVDPTTTTGNAQSATTGSGTGATFDLTFAETGWSQLARNQEAASATVSAAGNGYNVGDVLTLVGGVLAEGGSAATFTVATLTGGAGSGVATVTLTTAGEYEVPPSNAALTTNDGSGDNACTLTVTYSDTSGDTIVVLEGEAGGTETDPVVGIKTYSSETDESGLNTVYNWALFGMTSWASNQRLDQQANISPGFSNLGNGEITTSSTGDGAFVPLKDSAGSDIEWWFSITGRRIVMVAKVIGASTTYYPWAHLGLTASFGLTSEQPYPMAIIGSSDRKRVWFRDTNSIFGGLPEVITLSNGPAFVWSTGDGAWLEAKSGEITSVTDLSPGRGVNGSGADVPRVIVTPLGVPAEEDDAEDQLWIDAPVNGFDAEDITPISNATEIYPTPNTGDDLVPLYPISIMQSDNTGELYRAFGEIEGVFWGHDGGLGISSEDRWTVGSDRYLVFQSGTLVEPYSFGMLRED